MLNRIAFELLILNGVNKSYDIINEN